MIIGVTGFAQHGKTSVGNVLVKKYGFTQYAFADQLKSMALALNPIVQSYTFPRHPERLQGVVGYVGWEKAKEMGEVRRFLQVLGTEGVRDHLGEDAWVEALARHLAGKHRYRLKLEANPLGDHPVPIDDIVITDVRFPNEAEWIKEMEGELWRIKRLVKSSVPKGPDEDPQSWYAPFDNGIGRDHPSEKNIAGLFEDRRLVASNLDELEWEVDKAWQSLKDGSLKKAD